MGDIQTRPFSKNYSGLINQSVIGMGITLLCVAGHEFMKRKRRKGYKSVDGLGRRETWEFGYLYQGRSWARFPSPPSPAGWPLSWVKQVVTFSEEKMHELRGIDATLYTRFLRGCFWFAILQTLTTFPILFPIHVRFSDADISQKSMTRASIASLVGTSTGHSLLWIHICLLFWITFSWIATLLWICHGTFKLRSAEIRDATKLINDDSMNEDSTYYAHPHPQYGFLDVPSPDTNHPNRGLRLRTVMVSNVPGSLRSERDLKEYFEYYMSRRIEKPSMGLTSSKQPGFLDKSFAFLFNRAKRLQTHLPSNPLLPHHARDKSSDEDAPSSSGSSKEGPTKPLIERVVIVRKMTELASLLERREEILHLLETAHIKLANKALMAVKLSMEQEPEKKLLARGKSKAAEIARQRRSADPDYTGKEEDVVDEEDRMAQLTKVLGPFVEESNLQPKKTMFKYSFKRLLVRGSEPDISDLPTGPVSAGYPPRMRRSQLMGTIWDALLSLPRSTLDAYQPLVNLNHLFRGKTVPAIDYYTAKLNLLNALITENRAKALTDFDPASTAFVTFANPADARRACKYLAVHPNNPMACVVTMAPTYHDLDWIRLMKSSFRAEFVKDWVVNLGVWGFTLFWIFPVSLLVGLVSIQNISLFWPSLKRYLDKHEWQSEVLQSFIPTLLVALLALLIPLILLLIAKKAHTILTLSELHDRIMTRYYKFLIVNVLVFFCVGTAALQSFLLSFRSTARPNVLQTVADSFPTAGPFYVGWLIFTTAMHGGFELALLGLPLILYPSTSRQVTPRKRAVGIRPRTFNFYYWLPNHMLVIHVLLLFSVLNPFVLPFGVLYFFVESGVVKNQLIHVYAKNYEGNGQILLIRIVRYSLDGLVLSQGVFLAYMVVLKNTVNVALSAILITFTVIAKLLITRICRARFERCDFLEAEILCNGNVPDDPTGDDEEKGSTEEQKMTTHDPNESDPLQSQQNYSVIASSIKTWRLPEWVKFSYSSFNHRPHRPQRRPPIPFGPNNQSFSRLKSRSMDREILTPPPDNRRDNGQLKRFSPKLDDASPDTVGDSPISHMDLNLERGFVISHPSSPPWDDQRTPDLPYDNPFYARPIDNALWLPRNPSGVLDLDDTIDMKLSLTVEVSAGQLGTWSAESTVFTDRPPLSSSPVASPSDSSIITAHSPSLARATLPKVDGTEEIDLPPAIAKRVQAKEDVDQALQLGKSSTYRGKTNVAKRSMISLVSSSYRQRHSSFIEGPSPTFPSLSEGKERSGRRRSQSIMSVLQLPNSAYYNNASDIEIGFRTDALPKIATSAIASTSHLPSRSASYPMASPAKSNLSTREAIFHEVLAEEQDARDDRIEQEEAETTRAQSTKSWLTSWMFRKPQ